MSRLFDGISDNYYRFSWDKLQNIKEGRRHLGEEMPVLVYRMLEYSMKNVLYEEFGAKKADELFYKAGYLSGKEYAANKLPLSADCGNFMAAFSAQMEALKIGIVRFEQADFTKGEFVITVHEDLDCSGLPVTGEMVCNFDEGFLAGVLECYLKRPVTVKEIDCWASGERVCRFRGTV